MSSPFIVIDEITTKINELNTSLTTKIDNVNSNISTLLTNTGVNNTASTTGTLSQKISSTISNTAATTTENSSGTLSAKLAYLINRREVTVIPSSDIIKTLSSSGSVSYSSEQVSSSASNSNYRTKSGTQYVLYVKHPGTYRCYFTASGTATTRSGTTSLCYSDRAVRIRGVCSVLDPSSTSEIQHNVTIVSATVSSFKSYTLASTTKTVDVSLSRGQRIKLYISAESQYMLYHYCDGYNYYSMNVTANWTDISVRGKISENTEVLTY